MVEVRGLATRYVDDGFPPWLEVILVDVHGVSHVIREKVPVLCAEPWPTAADPYPMPLWIGAEVLAEHDANATVRLAWRVEDEDGNTDFDMASDQVRACRGDSSQAVG